jgi:succinate dehydrogenase / fumarate reductase flavoprotein subunit
VYGRRAGVAAAVAAKSTDVGFHPRAAIRAASEALDALVHAGTELSRAAQRDVRDILWEHCGVVRDESSLRRGLSRLEAVASAMADIDVRPSEEGWTDLAQLLDLRAGVVLAEATVRGAMERRETRGCHNRSDFPELDPSLRVNLRTSLTAAGELLPVQAEPVPAVPTELEPWLARRWDADLGGRLLE